MIDVIKEFEKYKEIDLDIEESCLQEEFIMIFQTFQKTLNRFGKEQYKTVGQLEEIVDLLEEEKELETSYRELKEGIKKKQEEVHTLLQGLITAADKLEDIYRYTLKKEEDPWAEQISMLWESLGQELSRYGIIRIEGIGSFFSTPYYSVEGIKKDPNLPHGTIIEVLQAGYTYQGTVIRKAKVIVNENQERMES